MVESVLMKLSYKYKGLDEMLSVSGQDKKGQF